MSDAGSRHGFTLVEAMLVVVVAGIMAMFGYPKLQQSLIKANVRNARSQAIALYSQARSAALETGRVARLTFGGTAAVVTASPRLVPSPSSTVDTIGAPQNFTQQYGVTVTGSPAAVLTIDPRGLGSAATTVYFDRAGVRDSMVVSGFGRVVK